MRPVVVSEQRRTDGSALVTLSLEGVRWTAVVPAALLGTPQAEDMYEAMATRQLAEMAKLREITAPGRLEREA